MIGRCLFIAYATALVISATPARAQDAGEDAGTCISDTGTICVPLACDGDLCDTTNGSTCGVVRGVTDPTLAFALPVLAGSLLFHRSRRGRRQR
jgi:hypothetical protein